MLGRRLLAGTAAIALLGGSIVAYAVHAEVSGLGSDPFAAANDPNHKPAQASVAIPDFVPIVDAVKPAVVSVRVKSRSAEETPQDNPFEGTPFEQFFRRFGQPNNGFGNGQRPRIHAGAGLRLHHLAGRLHRHQQSRGRQRRQCAGPLDDGTQLDAKVVGTTRDRSRVAQGPGSHRPAVREAGCGLAQDRLVGGGDGQPVRARRNGDLGIVSAKGRDIGNGPYDDYIQIDAPVNRGNSGGPTFDMKGEVIGVNTAIYSPSGGSVGIAFDIPADTVKTIVTQLRETRAMSSAAGSACRSSR